MASQYLTCLLRSGARGSDADLAGQHFRDCAVPAQQAAFDEQYSLAVAAAVQGGWTPLDLYEVTRRITDSPALSHLLDCVATFTRRHAPALVDPRWSEQLDQLGAVDRRVGGGSPSDAWARAQGLEWTQARGYLIAVLAVVSGLPPVERVLPPHGSRPAPEAPVDDVSAVALRRVRGLLAKAESTEHPAEAEALTAKAQELMTRHSIERAVAESSAPTVAAPVARRIWLENPYLDAKGLLVSVVADANNCRAVQGGRLGFLSIVGHRVDLDLVELLVTSLLVQATRAMNAAGTQVDRYGRSRTRSFRQSFLVAYAGRIGERLRDSSETSERESSAQRSGALVPLLAARRAAVDTLLDELFPRTVERGISTSNAAGAVAGRVATDLAQFDVHASIR